MEYKLYGISFINYRIYQAGLSVWPLDTSIRLYLIYTLIPTKFEEVKVIIYLDI